MREWCGCGAAIRAGKRQVIKWRTEHKHPAAEEPAHPPTSGGTDTSIAWQSIGFRPDEA